MKENKEDLGSILAKAEKFFSRGNYPLARAEFEKAARRTDQPDITDKIAICRREIDAQKAKELTKKAKRLVEKNNIDEAIRCYEQAFALSNDARLAERLDRLRTQRQGQDMGKGAREAEATGNLQMAAQLYGQAFETQGDKDFLIGKARCLVMAGHYQEAISILATLDGQEPCVRYDYGFALARTGRYYEGLKIWEGLQSQDDRFRAQQVLVRSLLAADLFERWARQDDLTGIYEQGSYLLTGRDRQELPAGLETLVEHCRPAQIDSLWRERRFATIAGLLQPFPTAMDAPMLALCARTYYKLVEEAGTHLPELTLFWLTAIFDRRVSAAFADNEVDRRKVQAELIRRAEKMIAGLAESGDETARKELPGWTIDQKLIETIERLAEGREPLGYTVCTPRFARRFGRSVEVLALIRDHRESFASDEDYLDTGSYFTDAAESLYLLALGDYDRAMAALPEKRQGDDFLRYGILKVSFLCGLHHIEKKTNKPWRFFEEAAALFDLAPRYEEELVRKEMLAHGQQLLESYEAVLGHIYRQRPTKKIAEALSRVITDHALFLANHRMMSAKALEGTLHKALTINPDNELARLSLGDAQTGLEIMEMQKAMNRHKMAKAFKIAHDSPSPEVRDKYFESLEYLAEDLEEVIDIPAEERALIMEELRDWCAKLDEAHPLVARLDRRLRFLQDQ